MSFAQELDEYLTKAAFKKDHQAVLRKVQKMVADELAKRPPRRSGLRSPAPVLPPAPPVPAPVPPGVTVGGTADGDS